MPWERVNIERLQRLFYEGFSVMDVAEPLCIFSAAREAEEADRAVKELEALRNNLAHSQKIVDGQWRRIPIFSSRIDRILSSLGRT